MYDQGFERHVWRGAPRMGHGGWSVECTPAHKPNVHIPGNILNFLKNSNIQELLSAPPVIFGCEDLLLEKYGSAIVGIINRYPPIQHNSLLHNSHAAHAGASTRHLHLSDRKPDNIASRQAAEECLFSRSGDNFEASMDVSGDLDDFEDDTQKKRREDVRNGSNVIVRAGANPVEKLRSLNELRDFRSDRRFENKGSHTSRDAKRFCSDATTNNHGVRFSPGSKVHGNHQDILKINVFKNSCDRPNSSRPLRAAWADFKNPVVPFKQSLAEASLRDGSCGKPVSEKRNTSHFHSHGRVENDEYGRHRLLANALWRTMNYYFKEAAAAYDRGEHCRAATLSGKGKEYKYLAQQADELASQLIFQSKNKDIVNIVNIEIDLHALHVGEALRFLQHRLQTFIFLPSVNMLTVITGYGSHSSNGCAKIKPAVTDFLVRNGIPWGEPNEGCLTIKSVDVCNKELNITDGN
ncbi:uncharacterized protein [Physcomitrium patens]|uniref:Smr domain-containing protein n=1 Tax=Physcomitrium patens TaxID=3218 RepID=A0A7I4EPH0_PHYPA|nr:uncharacterized protein LOC112286127 isoform X3 [Physcomitrium patens]|eukprot:XP_024383514.1 uncharacterized protein LOC112286127 isoform X3 [Physcomitrella patens]